MTRVRRTGTVLLVAALPLVGLTAASAASPAAVQVTNAGYAPKALTVPVGTRVVWTMKQGSHTVTAPLRLGLFDSGTRAQGSTYAYTFINSGTFGYSSTVGPAISGSIVVPMKVTPATGNRTRLYAVRWGSDYTPDGYGEQVEIKEPGSSSWQSFVYGTTVDDATMRPVDWGNKTGTYQFRAKLYKGSNPARSSGWSPVASITVH